MGRDSQVWYIKNMKYTILLALIVLSFMPAFGQTSGDGGANREREQEVDRLLREMGIRTFDRSIDAVNFNLPSLDQQNTELHSLRGEFIFLNFWATWCPPCREEMPAMEKMQEALGDLPFRILAVSVREDPAVVSRFIQEYRYTFPVLLDRTGSVSSMYGVRGIPSTFFITPEGRVAGMIVGILPWDDPAILNHMRRIITLYGG